MSGGWGIYRSSSRINKGRVRHTKQRKRQIGELDFEGEGARENVFERGGNANFSGILEIPGGGPKSWGSTKGDIFRGTRGQKKKKQKKYAEQNRLHHKREKNSQSDVEKKGIIPSPKGKEGLGPAQFLK